ncbi:hypothetical protein [Cupriavidus gilardii]|uniref:hypothetical protein n=1 Tax=Cupriavidus gilardii TaxID=82541 RepID=UPI0021BF3D1B|nr:hypothetical protein [Cupriavidus gilardii]MCT9125412.1 hypothetical protein [Cupriavidus gilardii]
MSGTDRKLIVLAHEALDAHWPIVGSYLDAALEHSEDELTADDIREMVRREQAFVLVVIDGGEILAAGAVEIVQYPRYKAANIIAVGGRQVFLRRSELDWLQMVARDMGCKKLQTYCRPSMARLLGRLGMREAYRVMRCDL